MKTSFCILSKNTLQLLQTVEPESHTLLYCARFHGERWASLLLASGEYGIEVLDDNRTRSTSTSLLIKGTVFGQIQLWHPAVCTQPVAVLKGHDGVVFNVRFNADGGCCPAVWRFLVLSPHFCAATLAATFSDDRSARIWKLPDLSPRTEPAAPTVVAPRLVFYGHSAR